MSVKAAVSKAPGAKTSAEDVRIQRTRQKLAEAVITLAAERDITTASVSELTRRAGISRTRFYCHAESPVELLTRVLSADLDALRCQVISELESDHIVSAERSIRNVRLMIAHVLRHENIYGVRHASSVFALRVVLAEHVESSLLTILRGGFVVPPDPSDGALTLYAAYLAHGIVGAIDAWLRLPCPRDAEQLVSAIEALYPAWFWQGSPSANAEGPTPLPTADSDEEMP